MALYKIQRLADRLVLIRYLALLPPPAAVVALHLHQAPLRVAVMVALAVAALTLLARPPAVPATLRVPPLLKETTEEPEQGGRRLEAVAAVVLEQPEQTAALQAATAATELYPVFLARPSLTRVAVAVEHIQAQQALEVLAAVATVGLVIQTLAELRELPIRAVVVAVVVISLLPQLVQQAVQAS